jgi:hypothetical protein
MTPRETLRAAYARGLTLTVAGNKLRIAPAARVDAALRAALAENKASIVRMLTGHARDAADLRSDKSSEAAAVAAWSNEPFQPHKTRVKPPSSVKEAARRQALAQLAADPTVQRAIVNRFEHGVMIVTLAIRDIGTCELLIPVARFNSGKLDDYAALLACLNTAGGAGQTARLTS